MNRWIDEKIKHEIDVYHNSVNPRCIRNYEIVCKLATGGFGAVYKVKNTTNMKEYALKMSIKDFSGKDGTSMLQEVRILSDINCLDPKNKFPLLKLRDSFVHDHKLCMVFPLMGETIARVMDDRRFYFKRKEIQHVGYQIFQGLNFLHMEGITHTDIKPDNIMFTTRGSYKEIRIIDVGLARFSSQDKFIQISNDAYQAPEIILDRGYNTCSDIWAAGTLYQISLFI